MIPDVNERSTTIVRVSFFDEDNAPVVPSAGTYRVDDVHSGASIVDTSVLPSLSANVDVEITSAQNTILNQANQVESRRLTVEFDYGNSRHGTAEYTYRVRNLRFAP